MISRDGLKKRWAAVRGQIEIADIGFLLLRAIALAGGVAWLLLEELDGGTGKTITWILVYFTAYSSFLYLLLFFRFPRKRGIYRLSLAFDLSFVHLLIVSTGGLDSSFFIGFYLLTALHAFYYGYVYGLLVATACTAVYYLSASSISPVDWIDFSLRASFLFLIAIPIGLWSGKLRKDKEKIESLNVELLGTIEEMRKLQAKLIEAEKLSALGRLTSDVAHEIRNPLTVVGGFAKRLEKRLPESTKEKEYSRIIVAEVARLERILKDVLIFSRETKHRLHTTNINSIISETAQAYSDPCREKGIRLNVETDDGLPACNIDRDQIRQAVTNLVTNAIDAMLEGGTLTLSTRRKRENGVNYVVVDVIDTGFGIPREKVDQIFEPFYSTKEIGKGTGLGLSICKKIMEEHRGLITVESLPGAGSTFSLHIPYMPEGEAFKVQCWEYIRCGVDQPDATLVCPSYPNFGRICWAVAGTFAETKVCGVKAQKIGDCRKCDFYARIQGNREP